MAIYALFVGSNKKKNMFARNIGHHNCELVHS